jgi:hypothetical protein
MWILAFVFAVPDLPPLADAERFPLHAVACECLAFNRAYRGHLCLCLQLQTHQEGWLTRALAETDALAGVWEALVDTQDPCGSESWRRQRLGDLRDLLGPQAYAAGVLPPPVPLWLFQKID